MANSVVNYDFENPFGNGMNPLSGGGGVLEQIQEQVSNNGDVLRSMQGGIGGIDGSPFVGATQNSGMGMGNMFNSADVMETPSVPEGIFDNPINASTGGSGENPIRAQYDKAVEDARQQRANGFMGRVVLPGEMPFEDFSQSQLAIANSGPLQSVTDLSNIDNQINNDPRFNLSVGAEQNPGMDYSQFTPKMTDQLQPSNLDYIGDGVQNTGVPQPGSAMINPTDMSRTRAQLFKEGGVAGLMMKKTEIMERPADRGKLVLDRIMKQAGAAPSNDPRLMAQLAQVLGRDG